MAKKHAKKTREAPPGSSSAGQLPRPVTDIEIRPPVEVERTPPPVATHFWVTGGADALILEFFYIDQAAIANAMLDGELREDMELVGTRLRIRQEPIARVALPLNVSMDVVSRLFRFTVQGLPTLTTRLNQIGREMVESGKLATDIAAVASGQPVGTEPPETHNA